MRGVLGIRGLGFWYRCRASRLLGWLSRLGGVCGGSGFSWLGSWSAGLLGWLGGFGRLRWLSGLMGWFAGLLSGLGRFGRGSGFSWLGSWSAGLRSGLGRLSLLLCLSAQKRSYGHKGPYRKGTHTNSKIQSFWLMQVL